MEIQKSITMKDVARLAGVSVGTVSRVINNESGIKETTLEKVNAAVKELNYIPDVYARGMKKNKTETIALIIPTVWHPFFGEFAYHVEVELSRKNYKLLLCNISGPKRELDYLMMLQQNKVDGIIAITYSPIDDYLSSNIPFVSIDRTYENKAIACVSSDNQAGAELAADILIERGGSHFAFIGGHNRTINETKKRRLYFEKRILEAGYPCHILDLEEPYADFMGQVEDFLVKHPQIDAIFTINDFAALDTLAILEKLGRQVPDDVQVIGYDGIQMAEERQMFLSTIRQPLDLLAKEAVACLLDIIDKKDRPLQVILPISYVEGKTTKNRK
ncbi:MULTISPECIES: LacI family DNA-binding transcriptional regulator [Streptococcus]|uniref:LacI family DNA-binding transcriptional regulator n=4 Tax=Streptococcus ruminantium TaxID=1917441 RepID=A0ABU1B0T6_9STRE|nr:MULTISPECIES: LacI family DNA-binding transcriptional regulator [Streptococcus]MDQ8759222.1 LacI family DNA-binding transcriptional regulator [Streptococcus ruminantium]MDQ8769006.1 LacI family DNA-binding transcriptional regulator [Streptococcus ruminantium]MDQ8774398.1 LacI family DNA-binding transcriptional regulator [Streptococcus ruminantium]MDQ8794323.1 LacI family DNA-binding transcriptional regulator [Streptococcus ruminantium]MDQ8795617.1 LacI family DNA-binding transcriptional reg